MARTRTRRRVLARDRIRWSFAAYPLTLVVLAVGAFRLPGRTWGIEAWAWIPPAWAVGLAALGVAAGLVARRTGSRDPEAFPRLPRALTLVALLGLAASFWFLRTRAHFLGDGYQNLGILAADHVRVKDTARGTLWILIRLKELFGGGEAGALAAYRALALVSGAAWLAVVAAGARRVVDGAGARSFAAVVMLSGPALLFFGYVENYAPFALAVTAFTFTGLHVARTGRGRWLMPGLAGIAILLHVLGFTLLPALLWALVAGTPAGDFLARLPASRRWTGVIGLALVAALFGVPAWRDSLTLQFALVPLPGSPYAVEGYTLFSVAHLADLANLAFLLVPGGALLAAAAAAARGRTGRRPAEAGFLAVLIASTTGAVFLLDPRLGMPRDWDVFAFAGIPWAVALGWAWSRAAAVEPRLRLLGPLAALLGILVLLPRLLVLSDPETAVRQFESYLDLDFRKGRNGRLLLVNHYRETGRDALAEAELESW
ncbi:MAG TPA: hypothetical protein VKU85_18920, partial [bacterium]|nr:hypothetical protein [bacterium]